MSKLSLFIGTLMITGVITGFISILSLRRRKAEGALAFSGFMLALTIYTIGYGFELSSFSLLGMLFFIKIEFLGIAFIPALYLITALQVTDNGKILNQIPTSLFFIIPVMTLVLCYTNDYHHLFFATVGINKDGPFPIFSFTEGPWYWMHIVYINISLIVGNILFLRMFFNSSALYRKQAAVMVIASIVPWTAFIVFISGNSPWGIDLNPFLFSFSGIIFAWGFYRFSLFDITPIAKNVLMSNMVDGVLVINRDKRIIEVNPEALKMLDVSDSVVGHPVNEALAAWPDIVSTCNSVDLTYKEFIFNEEHSGRWLEFRAGAINNRRGRYEGILIIIRDITDKKRLEHVIAQNEQRLRNEIIMMRRIQALLLPELNLIGGYDIASVFFPADDLSGDFFDGYFIDEDVFQIVICDVAGHGMVSSYVGMELRSLFKAFSSSAEPPSRLIKNVNDTFREDFSTLQYFATMIVCRVNTRTGEVVYSSGGHPPMLKYTAATGDVTLLVSSGPLIGLDFIMDNRDVAMKLEHDDCLLLYTDGVCDSPNKESKEMYGLERLMEDFKKNIDNPAQEILHAIMAELFEFIDFNRLEDDVSMLCVKRTG